MNFPSRLKVFFRRLSVRLCRALLWPLSRPYVPVHAPALILAPHQDDETLACGTLIARKRDAGHEVHVVFLTDGGASHPDHPGLATSQLVALRHREARQALDLLGVDSACVHFWDEPDGSLKEIAGGRRALLVAKLAALVEQIKPGRLFVPCSPDGSSEHDPVLGFAAEAIAGTPLRPEIWQYPVWSWWNPPLLFGKIFSVGNAHRLAGEDFLEAKRRALDCYRSQIKPTPPWPSATLPPELLEFCLHDPEYYFLTPATLWETRRPVI
jgi:LmbE family N-acetylglucosaminyl deacetylase